jgi:transposase-like protein
LTADINAVIIINKSMRTKYCPHCSSEKIHRVEEGDGGHFHECEECQETWEHHESTEHAVVKSNN